MVLSRFLPFTISTKRHLIDKTAIIAFTKLTSYLHQKTMSLFSYLKKLCSQKKEQALPTPIEVNKEDYEKTVQFFTTDNISTVLQIVSKAVQNKDIKFLAALNQSANSILANTLQHEFKGALKKNNINIGSLLNEHRVGLVPTLFFGVSNIALKSSRGSTFHRCAMANKAYHQTLKEQLLEVATHDLAYHLLNADFIPSEDFEIVLKQAIQKGITVNPVEDKDPLIQFLKQINAPESLLSSQPVVFFNRHRKESRQDIQMAKELKSEQFNFSQALEILSKTLKTIHTEEQTPEYTALCMLTQIDYRMNNTPNTLENLLKQIQSHTSKQGNFQRILQFHHKYQVSFF